MFRLTAFSHTPTSFNIELHDGREGILVHRQVERDGMKLVWTVQIYAFGTESVHYQQDFDTFLLALDFLMAIRPKEDSEIGRVMGKRYGEL
jgi:beta-galactosidase GanA